MVKPLGVARADCLVCVVDVPPGETDPERYCIAAAHAALPRTFLDHELRLELLRSGFGRDVRRVGLCVLPPGRTPPIEVSPEVHTASGRTAAKAARETAAPGATPRGRPAFAGPWQDGCRRITLPVHRALVECRKGTAIYHGETGDAQNLILVHDGLPVADSLVWNAAAVTVEAVRLQHLAVGRGWSCGAPQALPETAGVMRRRLASRAGARQSGRQSGLRPAVALILVAAVVIAEFGLALRRGGTSAEVAAGVYAAEPRVPTGAYTAEPLTATGGSSAAGDDNGAVPTGSRGAPAVTTAREVTEPTIADQLASIARRLPDGLVVETLRYGDGEFFLEATASGMDSLVDRGDGETGLEILRASAVDGTDHVLVEARVVP